MVSSFMLNLNEPSRVTVTLSPTLMLLLFDVFLSETVRSEITRSCIVARSRVLIKDSSVLKWLMTAICAASDILSRNLRINGKHSNIMHKIGTPNITPNDIKII